MSAPEPSPADAGPPIERIAEELRIRRRELAVLRGTPDVLLPDRTVLRRALDDHDTWLLAACRAVGIEVPVALGAASMLDDRARAEVEAQLVARGWELD